MRQEGYETFVQRFQLLCSQHSDFSLCVVSEVLLVSVSITDIKKGNPLNGSDHSQRVSVIPWNLKN